MTAPAKLRHIALSVRDVAETQKFLEDAFGMIKSGDAGRGVYMTDGTICVAVLDFGGNAPGMERDQPFYGVCHFGMWVDDTNAAVTQVEQAGGRYFQGNVSDNPNTYFEAKVKGPDDMVIDLTHSGWSGAVKNVQPV